MTRSAAAEWNEAGMYPGQRRPASGARAIERRRAERACYLSPVRVLRGERVLDGTSRDISASGLLVTVPSADVAVGDTVVVRFALPVTRSIVSVRATVMRVVASRSAGLEVGLRLSLIPDEAVREIEAFVTALGSADGVDDAAADWR